jgi:hypothetical protein
MCIFAPKLTIYKEQTKNNDDIKIAMKRFLFLATLVGLLSTNLIATERIKLNFNAGWRLEVGDFKDASQPDYDDSRWQAVT